MFSPSLITYTFYRNDEECEFRKKEILRYGQKHGLTPAKVLNMSRSVKAFNFIFGGGSVSVPLCSDSDQDIAVDLLNKNLIDAYYAGIISDKNKSEWYYQGDILAVALMLSEKFRINVSSAELQDVLEVIRNSSGDNNKIIQGFEKGEISSLFGRCRNIGYEFTFLNKIESRYQKYIENKKWYNIFWWSR